MLRVKEFLHWLLESPQIFEMQQRLCNNYIAIGQEFDEYINREPQRIIDIGCSTGTCAEHIIDFHYHDYTGVDIERKYIEAAKKRVPRGNFVTLDARSTFFPDRSFDIAMFIGVMHHMEDALVRDCLSEVGRIVKPDGCVLVAEPVFSRGEFLSTALLKLDRGKYIRDDLGYRSLFDGFKVDRQNYFRFSAHRFSSYVLSLK
jgi:SAM-dependent methyltransferase